MNEQLHYFFNIALIGTIATLTMDVWALFLKRSFNIPSLDYRMVGRWLGHIPLGRLHHSNITQASPVTGEGVIGWTSHYLIGIAFAGILLLLYGVEWLQQPTILPALTVGICTIVAPFFVMQPGMGAGIAAAKTPHPNTTRLKSLMAHSVFGVGLYFGGLITTNILYP